MRGASNGHAKRLSVTPFLFLIMILPGVAVAGAFCPRRVAWIERLDLRSASSCICNVRSRRSLPRVGDFALNNLCYSRVESMSSGQRRQVTTMSKVSTNDMESDTKLTTTIETNQNPHQYREKIILWRGEGTMGYSLPLRHLELSNSIAAILGSDAAPHVNFTDMLQYDGEREMSEREVEVFDGAMQFVTTADGVPLSSDWLCRATKRCSLIREAYEVLAKGDDLKDLAKEALKNGSLEEIMKGGKNEEATWRVRLRQYGSTSTNNKGRRFGKNVRSPLTAEKDAIRTMESLFKKFGGKVRLKDPDYSLYIFEGVRERNIILARLIAKGAETSMIAPATRICRTNTPLEPIAAFNICNSARVRDGQNVLDPYAGSCATLLAVACLSPRCKTVGIEIALKKFVKKEDVLKDFTTRGLTPPAAVIRGDCTSKKIRDKARAAIDDEFDAIVTDPPYGIREKMDSTDNTPIVQLLSAIAEDRDAGTRLLKKGGRLAAFIPITSRDQIENVLPTGEQMEQAGVVLTEMREQPLNEALSRWLVAFTCVR